MTDITDITDIPLRERAVRLGVETGYHDVEGTFHEAGDAVLERVVAALEADLAAARATAHIMAAVHLATGGPLRVGASVADAMMLIDDSPVDVTVRRDGDVDVIDLPDDLPFGCHTLQLTTAAGPAECLVVVAPSSMPRDGALAGRSGLFVPAYALWDHDRPLPSFGHLADLAAKLPQFGVDVLTTLPLYAAFLDEPFDPSPYSPISRLHWNELYLDDGTLPPAPLPPMGELVDWAALAVRRRRQLIDATEQLSESQHTALAAFAAAHPDVGSYARFRAQRESAGGLDALVVEQSHVLAQFLADEQLAAIRPANGGSAALALDLPIGSHPEGYEVWANPGLFARDMAIGAPPDTFFREGQNWGFPPQLPAAMHASGYQLWRQLIARVGRHADVLRIDHAMAIHRLWWVPEGFSADQGVYVRYPRETLLAVIAAEAAAAGVTIVGEDLGTVPEEVSEAFQRWDVIGMYEEQFHLTDSVLPHIPARSVAGIRTHDMPALAEVMATTDTSGYRERLGAAHGCEIDDTWPVVLEQMLRRLAASEAYLIVADLDDFIGETRPHNLPGRVVPGLWQRRLDRSISEVLADPDVCHRLSILGRSSP
jgi:4-alpha-glucanotransferase